MPRYQNSVSRDTEFQTAALNGQRRMECQLLRIADALNPRDPVINHPVVINTENPGRGTRIRGWKAIRVHEREAVNAIRLKSTREPPSAVNAARTYSERASRSVSEMPGVFAALWPDFGAAADRAERTRRRGRVAHRNSRHERRRRRLQRRCRRLGQRNARPDGVVICQQFDNRSILVRCVHNKLMSSTSAGGT